MVGRDSWPKSARWFVGLGLVIQACSPASSRPATVAAEPKTSTDSRRSVEVSDPGSGLTLTVPWQVTARVDSAGVHLRHEIPYRHVDFCDESDGPHTWFDTVVDFAATFELRASAPVACLATMGPELASRVHGDSVRTDVGYLDAVVIGGRRGYRQLFGVEGCGGAAYWLEFGQGTLHVHRGSVPLVTPIYRYWRDVLAVPGVLTPAVADSLFEVVVRSATTSRR
jgi:hypothetical protein